MIAKIKNFQYYALVATLFFALGLITNTHFIVPKISATKYEMSFTANKDNKIVKLDSIAILKLENAISQVEKKNDGRFEVLTWSSVLILSTFAALLTINFFVSESKVKELVDIEISKKISIIESDIQAEYQKAIKVNENLEKLQVSAQTSLNKITGLLDNYEQNS